MGGQIFPHCHEEPAQWGATDPVARGPSCDGSGGALKVKAALAAVTAIGPRRVGRPVRLPRSRLPTSQFRIWTKRVLVIPIDRDLVMKLDEVGDPVLQASVIICAHNPRSDYFARVLASLRDQTLPLDNWELLIIDNASKVPLAPDWDISWHPTARHIVESEVGLAVARRRGIREACADLIVFVDDDNVLDKTYLTQAVGIGRDWPLLGAWGSGSIQADFEVKPSESVMDFLPYLALRETASPQWSNVASCVQAMPWGAGLCVRKAVAVAYCQSCERSSIQITGRVGNAL